MITRVEKYPPRASRGRYHVTNLALHTTEIRWLWDLRFSQRYCRRFKSSALWCVVV